MIGYLNQQTSLKQSFFAQKNAVRFFPPTVHYLKVQHDPIMVRPAMEKVESLPPADLHFQISA